MLGGGSARCRGLHEPRRERRTCASFARTADGVKIRHSTMPRRPDEARFWQSAAVDAATRGEIPRAISGMKQLAKIGFKYPINFIGGQADLEPILAQVYPDLKERKS